MGTRRNTEFLLLIVGSIPVFLLYAMYVISQGAELNATTLIVPIGLTLAFASAHIAIRILAPKADPAVLPIVFVLSGIGITFVTRLAPEAATRQVIWLFVSITAMIVTLALVRNVDKLARYKYTIGLVGLILLLLPIFFGFERNGSKLWIGVPDVLSFQPGEISKVLITIFLAAFLSENRELMSISNHNIGPLRIPRLRMLLPLFMMWLISLVIVIWERDLGSAALFFVIFVIMLYVATGRWFYTIIACLLLIAGTVLAYNAFGHVRTRIAIWLDPFADPSNSGLQIVQSLYSLADGDLLGMGIGKGMCDFIPLVSSDFIFAAIAEETGFLGGSAVILLFMLFAVRGFLTAARAKSDMAGFMAVGLTSSISFQAFLIIGGVTRLIPLTGVTLPFMSQGGSSLLASFIIVGLILRCGDEATGTQVEMLGSGVSDRTTLGYKLETPESGVLGRLAFSKRLTVVTAGFALLFAVLIGNLAWYQVVQANTIRSMPSNSHTLTRQAIVERGSILTSDGIVLAESLQQTDNTYTRSYPQGQLASHTIGYVDTRYGTTGIEKTYDNVLSGGNDYTTWTGTFNALVGTVTPGKDVVLTIDSRIQAAAEAALVGQVGGIVVLNPSTGAILAKASSPSYSYSELEELLASDSTQGELFDRTTQALYAPGSTFKTVTLAAALDSGLVNIDSVYAAPAVLEIGGGTVSNYDATDYGELTLHDAFVYSSNTVFAQVAVDLGAQALISEAASFGYGRVLGIGVPIKASLMPDPAEMTNWETAWAGAGQPVGSHISPSGPQTTVLQNAMIAAAIANDGILMEPYIVKSITTSNGTVVSETTPHSLGSACSRATAAIIGEAMLDTVNEGTGTAASIVGVNVAGKTGTAETSNDNPNAWFIGFAPYESPAVAVAVVIENDAEHTATGIAGNIMQTALEVLGR